jgi:DNA polymerase III epsilon subunit-like protein
MINTKPFCYYGFLLHQEEDICLYDFESGSINPRTTQPLELAAVMIDARKLEIIKDSLFCSKIKPLSDEDAVKKGLDPIQKSALAVNNLSLAELDKAPDEKTVWNNFIQYQYRFNIKKDTWNAAISCGFNITNFDKYIVDRLCKTYGPWDDKKQQQKIFNPVQSIDLKDITFLMNENNPEVDRNNFDTIRSWLNLDMDSIAHHLTDDSMRGAHSAAVDVLQGAEVLCKMMKLIRHWSKKTDFRGNR